MSVSSDLLKDMLWLWRLDEFEDSELTWEFSNPLQDAIERNEEGQNE